MNTMIYRGYTAHVEYDERDQILFGRVLGIKAIIGFHGETVAELRQDFENAIDFMIEDCHKNGKNPEQPVDGKIMLDVPPEVHGAVLVAVQTAGTSLNQWAAKEPLIYLMFSTLPF
ncbi:type II toxin-antitoxin system HicB family antitoxin [Chromatium okenii]|jgi:predicted HicB family RNase H-like nuclease|uniref:Toxin-antitoxin system HicB family antitoxin n=2 Tax=Chromatium okenii TaxID=61644 RepID=A0A2S7XNR8_9GAMM|nr:type II toxin-antitoxin system HicB family antitoxin [Chromatium okenii]PQJ95387.1 toxin-antitoxin system HicB family antitoxin [Chromatium okenii]